MATKTASQTAAEARKGLKTTKLGLAAEILPNIAFENKGEWMNVEFVATKIVPAKGDRKEFNVHDLIVRSSNIEYITVGKDKVKEDLTAGVKVSLLGSARLDRGFAQMKAGDKAMIEYHGLVDVGQGREANDYTFELIG